MFQGRRGAAGSVAGGGVGAVGHPGQHHQSGLHGHPAERRRHVAAADEVLEDGDADGEGG